MKLRAAIPRRVAWCVLGVAIGLGVAGVFAAALDDGYPYSFESSWRELRADSREDTILTAVDTGCGDRLDEVVVDETSLAVSIVFHKTATRDCGPDESLYYDEIEVELDEPMGDRAVLLGDRKACFATADDGSVSWNVAHGSPALCPDGSPLPR